MRQSGVISLTLVVAVLVGVSLTGVAQANGGFPTPSPPPDEIDFQYGEQCSVPGIVINSSTIIFQITGDTKVDGRLVWKQFDLHPGQRSTRYLCDTDYIGHHKIHWEYNGVLVLPKQWSPYMYNSTQTCRNHTVNGEASFRCRFTKWNWGRQD